MEIRSFKNEDISQVLELCREVRQHHIDLLNGFFTDQNDEIEQKFFLETIDSPNNIALVATENNIILGYILATIKHSPHLVHSNVAHICNFGVKKDIRRTGTGKKLMDKLFEICRSNNVEQISLGVYNKNISAYSFYEKYGFEPLEQKMTFDLTKSK